MMMMTVSNMARWTRRALVTPMVVSAIGISTVHAQGTAQASDSVLYAKAQEMVSNGEAPAGRALVDSMLRAAPAGSARYAEALYWHAVLAPTTTEAERNYRQIVVDYPMSSRVDDALLRMGQLEYMRGDREAALQHFQRLILEHPGSPLTAKASYWTARAYLDKNDLARGCAANADALAKAPPADVELRNQIDFQNQRCRGVAVTPPPSAAPVAAPASVPVPVEPPTAEVATVSPSKTGTTKSAGKLPAKPASAKSVVKGAKPAPKPVVAPEEAPVADAAPAVAPEEAAPKTTPKGAAGKSGKYAVQVAAFYDRPQADALVKKLQGRGYAAHVDGTTAPFRVRIGTYATHAQAATALANMKAKKMDGFVAEL